MELAWNARYENSTLEWELDLIDPLGVAYYSSLRELLRNGCLTNSPQHALNICVCLLVTDIEVCSMFLFLWFWSPQASREACVLISH
jgi:hypothetical protein